MRKCFPFSPHFPSLLRRSLLPVARQAFLLSAQCSFAISSFQYFTCWRHRCLQMISLPTLSHVHLLGEIEREKRSGADLICMKSIIEKEARSGDGEVLSARKDFCEKQNGRCARSARFSGFSPRSVIHFDSLKRRKCADGGESLVSDERLEFHFMRARLPNRNGEEERPCLRRRRRRPANEKRE